LRFLVLLLCPVIGISQTCDTAPDHKRYAFLIANRDYSKLPVVSTALEDAQVMRQALESSGFAVTLIENATMPDLFEKDQQAFLQKIQPGDIVFFYYTGHVVQGSDADTLILPVKFGPSSDINREGYSLGRFLEDLHDRKPGVTVIMVEGPRAVGVPIPSVTRVGLIAPDLRGMGKILFAMSARRGEMVESDPERKAELFSKAVAHVMASPGLSLREIFEHARQEVIAETNERQLPEFQEISSGGFCLVAPVKSEPVTAKIEPAPVVKQVVMVETVPNNRKDHEEYVRIPAGAFKMGCVPNDSKCKPDEKPQHTVTISKDFWMGRNEVEVGAFLSRFWAETQKKKFPPKAPVDYHGWAITNLPMVRVTWEQARDYCAWAGGRLPTEAEWEYAARAGASDEIYPLNSENSRDKANFAGTKGNDHFIGVAPVKSFDPIAYNLYDMAGNVWEWVSDRYEPNYYQQSPAVDPQGPPTGKEHIVRGGSFEDSWQDYLRLSLRWPQNDENFKTGFRCVLEDTLASRQLLSIH
jgi:formylglycine-generating enzyme required for sulfatase activity